MVDTLRFFLVHAKCIFSYLNKTEKKIIHLTIRMSVHVNVISITCKLQMREKTH